MKILVSYRRAFTYFVVLLIAQATVLPVFAQTATGLNAQQTRVVNYVLSESQKEAARLLLATAILQSHAGEMIRIDPAVRQKYDSIRLSAVGSPTVAALAGAVGYSVKDTAAKLKSSLESVTSLIQLLGRLVSGLGRSIANTLEFLKIDESLTLSADSIRAVYNLFEPVIKIFVSKGSLALSGTAVGSASLGTSLFLSFNGVESAASSKLAGSAVRTVIGYKASANKKIESAVENVSIVFNLSPQVRAELKEAIREEVVATGIQNGFDPNATYRLDVVSVLARKQLISSEQIAAVGTIRTLFNGLTDPTQSSNSVQEMITNIDAVLALNAYIEALTLSKELKEEDRKVAAYLLVTSKRKIEQLTAALK